MSSIPSQKCFELIQTLNFDQIDELSLKDIRFILPCLIRMCHCDTLDVSKKWNENRRKLKRILMPFQEAEEIKKLLEFDYVQLESEVKKDLQLRSKSPAQPCHETYLLSSIIKESDLNDLSLVKIFERESLQIRMKLVLSEMIGLLCHFKNNSYQLNPSNSEPIESELFDTDIFIDEFVDLIYFAISEMPNTFQLLEVVEALLIAKNGLNMICRLVANFPDSFHEICTTLINNSDQNEENNFLSINRVNVLRKLCQMNSSEALIIRSEAVELCRMPNLVVMLTLDHIKPDDENDISNSDVISFITGILLSNDDKIRTWFSQYIKRKNLDTSSSNCFLEFRDQLLKRFRLLTDAMTNLTINGSTQTNNNNRLNNESIITEACLMLRLYCALRGVAMMKLNEEETQAISRMIVCRPPHIDIGVRFVSVGLCMILAFPQMITSQETEIIEWIKWLVKEENYFGQKANTTASFGEMLLLIAIFFHSNQLTQIGELVSATIGIKHPLRTNDLTLIKHIFIQDIFTEQTVTSHAIKVPVTKNLNDSIHGALPIHCIYQLLKSRAFTKNKVPIKNWIFNQLCNCIPPIHHILPNLIEAYVNSILIPNTQSGHMTNEPIGEDDLNSVFNRIVYSFEYDQISRESSEDDIDKHDDKNVQHYDQDDQEDMEVDDEETEDEHDSDYNQNESVNSICCLLTSQLLFLYYVLLYEDVRLNNIRNLDRPTMTYSSEFMSRLPIFYLIQKTQTCPEEYGLLRPPLLRLISFHYPHLCLVKDWLPRPNFSVSNHRSLFSFRDRHQIKQIAANRKYLAKLFQQAILSLNEKPYHNRELFCYLEQIAKLPDELLWPIASDFIKLLPCILDEKMPKKILTLVRKIWFRLNHIFPTKLWVMTVNILRSKSQFDECIDKYTWEKIIIDPFAVLRCDQRVFRTPELMEITLHILNGFLSASKIKISQQIMEFSDRHTTEEERKKREDLFRYFSLILDSTSVQMLLECCSAEMDRKIKQAYQLNNITKHTKLTDCLLTNLRVIQGLNCIHLHQCFIAEWNIAKAVTFQGYDLALIPITVAGIPSMHICLDFIPDILQNLDLNKQSFAIDLTSHVCVQYPIIRSFNVAKLCFEICNTHLTLLPNSKQSQFYLSVLPALERMCQTFPPLIEGFLKLLIQLAQRNFSALSSKPTSKLLTSSGMLALSYFSQSYSYSDLSSLENDSSQQNNHSDCKIASISQLIDMTWPEFEFKFGKGLSQEELLALAIHKIFAMVCRLGSISRVFRDETI